MKKHHLSKWMFASDVVRATIVLIIPLLHFSHLLPLWLLISLMVIQSATGAAYNPASVAILPQIVPKHLIQKQMQSCNLLLRLLHLQQSWWQAFWLN